MTTTPIPSITDEQLAEIECSLKPIGFNSYNDNLRGLITRLRAAEKDAGRYRWLRDSQWYVGPDSFFCGEGGDMNEYQNENFSADHLDAAIDTAMQEQSK